jgi:opacity protein-like surface antigen
MRDGLALMNESQRRKDPFMRNVFACILTFAVLTGAALAQDAPKSEVFAGYSYLRANPGAPLSGENFNGFNTSATYNVNKYFGLAGEFNGVYGRDLGPTKIDSDLYTYVFGPRFTLRRERFNVFTHALFGGAHAIDRVGGVSSSDNAFAMTLGGGLDLNLAKHFAWRLAQTDYQLTRFGGDNQNHFRYSTGIVFRFGGK